MFAVSSSTDIGSAYSWYFICIVINCYLVRQLTVYSELKSSVKEMIAGFIFWEMPGAYRRCKGIVVLQFKHTKITRLFSVTALAIVWMPLDIEAAELKEIEVFFDSFSSVRQFFIPQGNNSLPCLCRESTYASCPAVCLQPFSHTNPVFETE